ncbi:hypothetical protein TorRG33x02_187400 [Trema orientale]|uniref:Uncharacterized protein n=1 Tax=Trema orientale TaxID=63057 RepID=A0A2P5EIS6_TREOI|nr:hypothetical protein TorRG33x02_187400 [Trema orientale]
MKKNPHSISSANQALGTAMLLRDQAQVLLRHADPEGPRSQALFPPPLCWLCLILSHPLMLIKFFKGISEWKLIEWAANYLFDWQENIQCFVIVLELCWHQNGKEM